MMTSYYKNGLTEAPVWGSNRTMVLVLKNEDRPAVALEWVKPPRQVRSQQTLERLLDAAEELILEKGPEGASVSGVAKRAKSSVGAFYARFEDKDALLRSVYDRFLDQATATVDNTLHIDRWQGQTLESGMRAVLHFLFVVTNERSSLLSGLVQHAQKDLGLTQKIDDLVKHIAERLAEVLMERGDVARGAEARVCVMGLAGLALGVVQGRAMRHPDAPPAVPDAVAAEQLTQMCLAYLAGVAEPAGRK